MINFVGKDIGRFRIIEQLGEGGMARVYKAYDTRLERNVALKMITPSQQDSAKFLRRFEREAKALAKLSHPNIVKVHDYGEEKGMPYLVMEFLPGGTLKDRMGKPYSYQDAARLLLPIARALEYAHSLNIVHRDIKPANILLTASGEPMLSDFGIAKILKEGDSTELTGVGVGIGTPEYMAPEQGQGIAVDQRADIYSLGVVFYELVTGRKPFSADTPMAVVFKHMTEPLPRPKLFVPNLPDEVESIIFRALAKKPEERFQNMSALVFAFEKMAQGVPTRQIIPPGEGATVTRSEPLPIPGQSQTATRTAAQPYAQPQTQTYSTVKQGPSLQPGYPTYQGAGAPPVAPPQQYQQPYMQQPPPPRQGGVNVWLIGGGITLVIVVIAVVAIGALLFWKYQQNQAQAATSAAQGIVFPTLTPKTTNSSKNENTAAAQTLLVLSTTEETNTKDTGTASLTPEITIITATFEATTETATPSATSEPTPTPSSTPTPSPTTPVIPIRLVYVVGDPGNTNIMIADEKGGNIQCFACKHNDQAEPKWSPDGAYVVFQANYNGSYDIWYQSVAGGDAKQITTDETTDEREPDWSMDGKIVYRISSRDANRNASSDLWVTDLNGNSYPLNIKGRGPVWSPDSKQIAYMAETGDGSWQIFVYDLDSKQNRQLTTSSTSCRWPSWSPDGQTIAFNTTTGASSTTPNGIWIIPISGGEMKSLANAKEPGRPSWSVSGWIAYNATDGIYIMKAGGAQQKLLIADKTAWAASWSR